MPEKIWRYVLKPRSISPLSVLTQTLRYDFASGLLLLLVASGRVRVCPRFGCRFITDELHRQGITVSENRVQRLCQEHHIWSVFAKKRGLSRKSGPLVHDDMLREEFFALSRNVKWLTDITEHPTGNGKLFVCVVKDVWSRRIVGYTIKDRMTSDLAVCAISNAVAMRGTCGTIVHSDRVSQFRSRHYVNKLI